MPKSVKGVLIDFVGTLVSFKPDPDSALLEMHTELVRNGTTNITLARLKDAYETAHLKYTKVRHEQLIEVSNEIWIHDALQRLGLDESHQALPRTLADAYFRSFVNGASVLPGVEDTLDYLRKRGYKLAVVSNFSYAAVPEHLLKQFDLNRYFDAVVISGRVGYRKPHPAIFQQAVRELGVGTEEVVMVGDTPTEDVYGAKKIGMQAYQLRDALVGYYTPYKVGDDDARFLQPDAVIGSFSELKQIL
jgi:putative hydrolase of the HAD superfamily